MVFGSELRGATKKTCSVLGMPIFKVEEIGVFQVPISSEGLMRDRPEYN